VYYLRLANCDLTCNSSILEFHRSPFHRNGLQKKYTSLRLNLHSTQSNMWVICHPHSFFLFSCFIANSCLIWIHFIHPKALMDKHLRQNSYLKNLNLSKTKISAHTSCLIPNKTYSRLRFLLRWTLYTVYKTVNVLCVWDNE